MIETGLLEAASRAIVEKEAASPSLFKSMGLDRAAKRIAQGARRSRPTMQAGPRATPKVVDAVSEPVARSGMGPGGTLHGGGGGGGMPLNYGDGGLIPSNRSLATAGAATKGTPAQNNLLKYLAGGGAAAAGAGGTAYAMSGGDEEAAAPVTPPALNSSAEPAAPGGVFGGALSFLNNMSPAARNALLGGGAGALAGGLYGLMSPGEETVYDDMGRPTGTRRKSRLMSALRNAAVVGGLGAGAGGLYGSYGGQA